ncbi:unnamed protein product [Chrysoparadoxa australica]
MIKFGEEARRVSEQLRHKHIRTLEVLEQVAKENNELRNAGDQLPSLLEESSKLQDRVRALEAINESRLKELHEERAECLTLREHLSERDATIEEMRCASCSSCATLRIELARAEEALREEQQAKPDMIMACGTCCSYSEEIEHLRDQLREWSSLSGSITPQDMAQEHQDLIAKVEQAKMSAESSQQRVREAELAIETAQKEAAKAQDVASSARARAAQEETERQMAEEQLRKMALELKERKSLTHITTRGPSSDSTINNQIADQAKQMRHQVEALHALKRENDRLRMQLGELQQSQAALCAPQKVARISFTAAKNGVGGPNRQGLPGSSRAAFRRKQHSL